MRLPPAPGWSFQCVPPTATFIYCSWPPVYSLFHVLKFKCGKHYQHPPWIIFCCCCCLGGRRVLFFFLFPFNFLCIVECIKWSKASFRLTKFKNYFLCSDAFVWKFIPVCTRQETRMWSSAHVGAVGWGAQMLWAPWIFSRKKEKDCKGTLGSQGRLSCKWLGNCAMDVDGSAVTLDWIPKHLQKSEVYFTSSVKPAILLLCHFSPLSKSNQKAFLCNTILVYSPYLLLCSILSPFCSPGLVPNFHPQRWLWSPPPYPTSKSRGGNSKVKMVPKRISVEFIILKIHLTYI